MKLELPTVGLEHYKSASQRARVATEAWAAMNLFCPNCPSLNLVRAPSNTPALDYTCPKCDSPFQLKSQSRPFGTRIVDAAYSAMRSAIEEEKTPNFLALHYNLTLWQVWNLILVPRFAFSLSALEKRNPLSSRARRAGWVGCNIVLANIPLDARIPVVVDGRPVTVRVVREWYARLQPLQKLSVEKRGWTLDVLNAIRSLAKPSFSLSDVYALEGNLARLHPSNRHIRDKIRQQLQVLRDLGLVEFQGRGHYRLI